MEESVPHFHLPKKRNAPWLTKHIVKQIRKRNSTFKAAKASHNPAHLAKYKKLRNNITKLLKKAKASFFKNLNPSNPKQFWKTVKYLNKQQSTIPVLHHQGVTASSSTEKANMLNNFFSECFNKSCPPLNVPSMSPDVSLDENPDLFCTCEASHQISGPQQS